MTWKPLINWKARLKIKWTNHCVLSARDADNAVAYCNNAVFVIKNTKWYVPVVALWAKDN